MEADIIASQIKKLKIITKLNTNKLKYQKLEIYKNAPGGMIDYEAIYCSIYHKLTIDYCIFILGFRIYKKTQELEAKKPAKST